MSLSNAKLYAINFIDGKRNYLDETLYERLYDKAIRALYFNGNYQIIDAEETEKVIKSELPYYDTHYRYLYLYVGDQGGVLFDKDFALFDSNKIDGENNV